MNIQSKNRIGGQRFRRSSMLAAILLSSLLLFSIVLAAAEGYQNSWWTVDSGGASSSNGAYSLSGTIGQPDAGVMSHGDTSLTGGFWSGVDFGSRYNLYLPLARK